MPTILSYECCHCHKIFKRAPAQNRGVLVFCCRQCSSLFSRQKITVPCGQCSKPVVRHPSSHKKSKSGFSFCDHHCSALYGNLHKTTGTRRSKLEIWLEIQLQELYPDQIILFNDKTFINSELDIFFPTLRLAFELNGIFHYEPIYGLEKLSQIQNNDTRKFQACLERGIELCILDTSSMLNFKHVKAKKFLAIICDIISHKTTEI